MKSDSVNERGLRVGEVKTPSIKQLDNAFLTCRATVHVWVEVEPNEWEGMKLRKPMFGWLRIQRCVTCDTLKRELIDARGEVGARSYRYPEGYKVVKPPKAKAPYRKEWMKRRGIRTKKWS